jgi:hypothetical protein
MILPLPKVTDITLAKFRGPRLLRIYHRIVEAYRKQHRLAALPLLLERLTNFILHPIALDRMFR